MQSGIKAPKDFWTGLLYVCFGIAALWIGADYRMGNAGRMGPGYFPKVLAVFLIGLGLISLARSFFTRGEPVGGLAWKPLILLTGATVLFGLAVNRLGLIVALLVLVLVSAASSREFRFDWRATAGLVALVAFCVLVFVKGIGVPMPIVGPWLEPLLGPLASVLR